MKKTRYTVIKNPLGGYDFSFASCHAAEIGAYIIGVGIAVLICTLTVCGSNEGQGWSTLLENAIYPIVFSIPAILGGLSMTFRIRKVKKIMKEGKMFKGEDVSYCRIRVSNGRKNHFSQKSNYTILNIKFYHNGEQKCSIGAGRKLPERVLASPYCTVYILNSFIFVTDFKLKIKGDPPIEFKLEEHYI